MTQLAPLSQFMPDLDMNKVTQFIFNAVGLDGDDVLKSKETKQAEAEAAQAQQAQAQSQEMMQSVVDKGTAPMINNAVENPEATQNVVDAATSAMQAQQQ